MRAIVLDNYRFGTVISHKDFPIWRPSSQGCFTHRTLSLLSFRFMPQFARFLFFIFLLLQLGRMDSYVTGTIPAICLLLERFSLH